MGLYDGYRLANSTAIPEFRGSMLPEWKEAKQELDQRYDFAYATAANTKKAIEEAPTYSSDDEEYKKVYDGISGRLKQISGSGDYENMVSQTQQLAADASSELKPFVESQARYQAYAEKLGSKDYGLDANTKQRKLNMAIEDDRSRKNRWTRDPITGKLQGGFNASGEIAKHVDMNEWIKKAVGDVVARAGGSEFYKEDGVWQYKIGEKTVKLSSDTLAAYTKMALANDPEAQSFLTQQAQLDAFDVRNTNPDTMPGGKIKDDILNLVNKGVPKEAAVRKIVGDLRYDQRVKGLTDFSSKYQKNDRFTTVDKSFDQMQAENRKNTLEAGEALILDGPTINLPPNMKTAEGVSKAVSENGTAVITINKDIAALQAKIATMKPGDPALAGQNEDLSNLQSNLRAKKAAYSMSLEIKRNSLDQAAKAEFGGSNISSFEEVKAQDIDKITKEVQAALGNKSSLNTKNGSSISATEIAGAILSNNIEKNRTGGVSVFVPGKGNIFIAGKTTSNSTGFTSQLIYNNMLDNVIEGAKNTRSAQVIKRQEKDYKAESHAIRSPMMTVVDPKILKAMEQGVYTQKYYDVNGNPTTPPKDKNFKKVEQGAVTYDGMVPTRLTDADGKVTEYLLDYSNTGLRENVGGAAMKTSNPGLVQAGMDMNTYSGGNLLKAALPANGELSENPNSGKQLSLNTKQGVQEVRFKRNVSTGNYSVYDAKTMKLVKDDDGTDLKNKNIDAIGKFYIQALNNSQ